MEENTFEGGDKAGTLPPISSGKHLQIKTPKLANYPSISPSTALEDSIMNQTMYTRRLGGRGSGALTHANPSPLRGLSKSKLSTARLIGKIDRAYNFSPPPQPYLNQRKLNTP